MKITIRTYKPNDCHKLYKLFFDTVHGINCRDYSKEQLNAWASGRVDHEAWNRSFLAHKTLVAEADGVIVGFGDMDISVECSMCASAYLDRLYVCKDHQRKGVGRAILSALEKYAEENAVGIITTYASITSLPFFEAMGYDTVRENTVLRDGAELTNYLMKKRT